jgi:mannose-6-phosphate isomerase-like protein (cupin superfamily)
MTQPQSHVVNVDEVAETGQLEGDHWGGFDKPLTPQGASLGLSQSRVPPGRSMCPFHYHMLEDEAFFIISGRGVLRYGEEVRPLRAGDCVYCPAGTRVAHQLASVARGPPE